VVEAFFQARAALRSRASGVRPALVMKLHREESWPEGVRALEDLIGDDPDVILVKQTLTRDDMQAMIARVDVVVSLHRSEGLGYMMMEAMLAGKPVIATGWSGNVDFMDAESSVLVPYTMVPVCDPQNVYNNLGASWAEPDVAFAARALERLFESPEERARLGEAGRQKIRSYCDVAQWQRSLPESFLQLVN
jgi:glycosyltransferase involved in cell wall biosynthesis